MVHKLGDVYMKTKLTKEMREKIIVGMAVASFAIVFYFVVNSFDVIVSIWNRFISVLFPFIIGFAIAFLMNPIMELFEKKVFQKWNCKGKNKRTISVLFAFIIIVIFFVILSFMIIPSVLDSVRDLVVNSDIYIERYSEFVTDFFKTNHLDMDQISKVVGTGDEFLNRIGAFMTQVIPSIVSTSYDIVRTLLDILIGVVAGVYLLLDKEKFMSNIKKINYAILPKDMAVYFRSTIVVCRNVFYDFIVGKAIDSLIIGIICYVGLSLLQIKYAPLLSVVVGITNMIPVFGPFIGAIPGIIILVIVEPVQALYFTIFIFALQQFDGNILGPLILGDKLGIPSFWILFSVTVGGAFFGVAGMFLGVPTFAVIYFTVREFINIRLSKKNIDVEEENL